MTDELRQDFTRRLSQCNQGGMIVIIYDIYFAYMDDARAGFKNKDTELFKAGVRKAGQTIDELINALNMSYDIAKQLLPLYKYCKIQMSKALYENKAERLDEADQIMKRLYDSFVEAARQDTSEPLMENTQQVYAGITYGKNDLVENCISDAQRGFFA